MLAAEMVSTNAKPRLIFPRNRKVGINDDTDFGQTRFNSPTTAPCHLEDPDSPVEVRLPGRKKLKIEWIRGRKFRGTARHNRWKCRDVDQPKVVQRGAS